MADTKRTGAPGTQPGAGAEGAVQAGAKATGKAVRGRAEAAGRGGEGADRAARQGTGAAASRPAQGAAEEADKARRGLVEAVEEAAAGMGSLIGPPNFHPGGFQDAPEAVAKLVEGVMATNMRFADELLRRAPPSAAVELQRRFLREYFDALGQGGALLLRAARQAPEDSARPLEEQARERGDADLPETDGTVADVMSKEVELASPDDTVQQAARAMGERGTGVLPVVENGRLVGVVTDRDLALRALAAGKDPSKTKLREVMSGEPRFVFADEPVEKAAAALAEQKAQRMPVLSRDGRLVGIVSLGDLARRRRAAGEAPAGTSRPGGRLVGGGDEAGG